MCAQSCPSLRNPVDRSPPGASVHGFSQARILEWVAISCSRVSSRPRDRTCVSCISAIGRRTLYPWEAQSEGAAITQTGRVKVSTSVGRGRAPDILKSACKFYIKLLLTGLYSQVLAFTDLLRTNFLQCLCSFPKNMLYLFTYSVHP